MATFVYYAEFAHYGYCENWIAATLDQNGHHCVRIQRNAWFDEQKLIKIIEDHGAHYLLLSKAPEIAPEQLKLIREQTGVKIVWWTFDWMRHVDNISWYGPLAREADICFQTDGTDADAFYEAKSINRIELHQGAVPVLHDIPRGLSGDLDCGHDIVFIGSEYTPRRHELVTRLNQYGEARGHDFTKYGHPQREVWGREFASACYLSKVVVGDNFTNSVSGYWSDRVYLTLACGGFFLTAYVPGLENVFENHKHLVWWKDLDELASLLSWYLPQEKKRKAIALEGYRLVHSRHTYNHRIQAMTEALEKL